MAEDNKNEFPDDDDDDFFGDGDDFGLPDLEYEALDERKSEPQEKEESREEIEGALSIDDPEDEKFDDSDLATEEREVELNEKLDAELDQGEFYEEESFDEFDSGGTIQAEAHDDPVDGSVFGSEEEDTDEFSSFESDPILDETEHGERDELSSEDVEKSKGKFTRIVIFGTIIIIGLGLGFLYLYNQGFSGDANEIIKTEKSAKIDEMTTGEPTKQPPEKQMASNQKPVAEKPVDTTANQQKEPAVQPPKPAVQPPKPAVQPPKKQANKPKSAQVASNRGAVSPLGSRTGNTYVIVGSFIDDDIANDFARNLSAQGKNPAIIPPFGGAIYYRVAIAGYPTLSQAQRNIDNHRSEFGQDVWLLKY